MHNHATAVLAKTTETPLVLIDGEGSRNQRLAKSTNDAAKALAARIADLMLFDPAPVSLPESETCPDCYGAGVVDDDGSFTGTVGWPVPCWCISSIPSITHPASHNIPASRNALLSAPLSRSGI